jgi:tetratricopeptide (TPR) repeat protein
VLKNPTLSFYFDNYKAAEYLITQGESKNFDEVLDTSDADIKIEIEKYINILRDKGRDAMVMDMTSPVLQVPSVWVYLKDAYITHSHTSFIFHVAVAHLNVKNYSQARPLLQKSLDLNNDKLDVHSHLGLCYECLGQYDEAIKQFKKGLEYADPAVSGKKECAGICMRCGGCQRKAAKKMEYFHYHIGLCLLKLADYAEAEKRFNLALVQEGSDRSSICFHLGLINLQNGKYRQALDNYKEVLSLPALDSIDTREVYFFMGRCYANIGEHKPALAAFEKARGIPGQELELFSGMGMCCIFLKDFIKAKEYLYEARAAGGIIREIEYNIGICEHELKEYASAIESFSRALKAGFAGTEDAVTESEIRFHKALSEMEMGNISSGIQELEQVKELGGTGREVRFNLGLGYENAGRYKEALAEYEAAIKGSEGITGREAGTMYLHKGICQMETGDAIGAKESVREAIQQNPEALENYNMLGSICRTLKEPEQGIEAINEGLSRGSGSRPTRSMSYRLLGVLKRENGKIEEAAEHLKQAITEDANEWSNYNVLGNLYRKIGRTSEAKEMYEQALKFSPPADFKNKIMQAMEQMRNTDKIAGKW